MLAVVTIAVGCTFPGRENNRHSQFRFAEPESEVAGDRAADSNVLPAEKQDAPAAKPTAGIRQVRYDEVVGQPAPAAELINPAVPEPLPADELPRPSPAPEKSAVTLDDVTTAVYASYPALDAAAREQQIAAGKQVAAMGQFDLNLGAEVLPDPLGFYKNYRYGLGVKQYAWGGGQTFAGYRLGRGNFEPWYLERETNKGGEFKAGFALPFLRGRDIDKRRAAVFKSQIDQAAAGPIVRLEIVDAIRAASFAYWDWVAAGQRFRIAQELLDLAATRQDALVKRAAQGDIAEIELVDNQRLIASRQAKLIDAERKLNQSAIKLSLFLRDPLGSPLLAQAAELPKDFPPAVAPEANAESEQVSQALALRPELALLDLERQRVDVEARQAANLLLPGLDGVVAVSQDVGAPTSPKRDKSQFELDAGAVLDVPLQRRTARGKLQAAQGKMAQIAAKRRLVEQKIVIDVQSARAGLVADFAELQQAQTGAVYAQQMEDAERTRFAQGDSNILFVNLREQATADARTLVVDATADYFMSQAQLHAAIAAELQGSPADRP